MTATELLRRLLDERGVEWEDCGNGATYVEHNGEAWRFDYDEPFDQLGIVCLSGYTPEQAIAATLGAGTCHNVWDVELTGRLRFQCSECGAVSLEITPRFCPACGRKVVEPTKNDVDVEVAQ